MSDEDYLTLNFLIKKEGKTMGELIRYAIRKTYKSKRKLNANEKAFREIERLVRDVDTSGLNYRELINYGRRY